jgi:hypothetical protein
LCFRQLSPYRLLNASCEESDQILNDDKLLRPDHLLNDSPGVVQGGGALKSRRGCGRWAGRRKRFGRVGSQGLQAAPEINLLEIGAVLPVPFGAFPGMPLLLAFRGAARLLPVAKARIW